ncbi:GntR family transcriptional regulator [Devosia sp. XJ19-1]|uniref:GntR family transcriptional regulator n=1 Tax=Devosia ureilytica TaxID=2952754 RepID=A0A9Q4FSW1_9HYPH|nr:GntR family transcriptional regulator [Devosia ureilytica]MCP8884129.1 GntR family transcriptional regulator [Devosia ureilytica]MCP8887737.1 GntR family transcriptional regulator [Devosia ureilytica]
MSDLNEAAIPTVGEATYLRMREDIIACRLAPGHKLRLDALRERYDVGVSTLREILNRLASESLVVAEGQKGFAVAPVTVQDLREIADLRLLLESHALGLSLAGGDLEWEGRIVAAHHKLAATEKRLLAGQERHTVNWVRYDFAFHNALISACGSQVLLDLHAAIFDRFLRYHTLAVSFRGAGVVEDHRALFDMALNRDVQGALAMLARHVNSGVEHVLSTGKLAP